MTAAQVQVVQVSFRRLEPVLESMANRFYERLFEADPTLKHMFRTPREEQARKLAHVLAVVVTSLDRPEQILGAVQEMGRRHRTYGVQNRHYTTVGVTLLWMLREGLGSAFTPDVEDGWIAAYTMLAVVMQEAAGTPAAAA